MGSLSSLNSIYVDRGHFVKYQVNTKCLILSAWEHSVLLFCSGWQYFVHSGSDFYIMHLTTT